MKVFLYYEDSDNSQVHKTLKITLPKSWKTGPTSNLLQQFVESYNTSKVSQETGHTLQESDLHLSIRKAMDPSDPSKTQLVALCSDAVVVDEVADRADVYICHGPSTTMAELKAKQEQEAKEKEEHKKNTVACTHFGCQKRFPKGGPYPDCRFHALPPVFHETAKYWACCPNKKAYDWDDFQNIPGCQTGVCTDVKDQEQKQFLGGTDLRAQAAGAANLKSIDDFNQAQSAGGAQAAPVLSRLQQVLQELGVEAELYNQVVEGIRKEKGTSLQEAELLQHVAQELGSKLKAMFKATAAEQLRIK